MPGKLDGDIHWGKWMPPQAAIDWGESSRRMLEYKNSAVAQCTRIACLCKQKTHGESPKQWTEAWSAVLTPNWVRALSEYSLYELHRSDLDHASQRSEYPQYESPDRQPPARKP